MLKNSSGIAKFIVYLLIAAVMLVSCRSAAKTPQQYEREQEKMEKTAQRALNKDIKAHEKMQDRETRKMMKRTKRQAKKYNKFKKK